MAGLNDIGRKAMAVAAALLLFVIAGHALMPGDPVQQESNGSAFSASTSDVAIGCVNRGVEDQRSLPTNGTPPPQCSPIAKPAFIETGSLSMDGRQQARAPPEPSPALAPISPRAPPAA